MSSFRLRFIALLVFIFAVFALPVRSLAQTKGTVTFGGLKNLEFIGNYYDGGGGNNLGLQFTSNAQAIVSANQGGSGNFDNNPGHYPVMFFQTGQNVTINATNGVETALYFYYSALQQGLATVYSGSNGTGNILASITLTANDSSCTTYALCVWSVVGVPLSTPAGSIVFAGVPSYIAVGTIHLGNPLATAETLTSSLPTSQLGEAVTFTADVTALGTVAQGSVTFKAGASTVLGTEQLVNGSASITTSTLKVGTTAITAKFEGAGFDNASKSVDQKVVDGN